MCNEKAAIFQSLQLRQDGSHHIDEIRWKIGLHSLPRTEQRCRKLRWRRKVFTNTFQLKSTSRRWKKLQFLISLTTSGSSLLRKLTECFSICHSCGTPPRKVRKSCQVELPRREGDEKAEDDNARYLTRASIQSSADERAFVTRKKSHYRNAITQVFVVWFETEFEE